MTPLVPRVRRPDRFAIDHQPWVVANFSGILCVDEVYWGNLALLVAVDPAASEGDRLVGYTFGLSRAGSVALARSLFATASSAFAFDCTVANKPTGAGSVVTVDVTAGEVTSFNKPNPGTEEKPHGAFVTLTNTPIGSVDTFVHAPQKAQAPQPEFGVIPGATNQESLGRGADGKGLDTIEARIANQL